MIAVTPAEDSTVSVIGGEAAVDNAYVPELDITYFFTDHIAAELILATAKHDVEARGSSLGPVVDLGDVWLLPPTLTAQYHFMPEGKIRPYVGAGINYTFFYNEDPGAVSTIDYDNGFGYALQVGTDVAIDDHWAVNFDVKKLWLNTDVTVAGGPVVADVDLDPWIFGVGVGYRF